MPIISADELALLRTFNPGSREDTFASFLKPLTLWAAQVNSGGLSRGDMAIPFNTGSGSHWSAIEGYQEVWIGTVAGANDVARLRIRSVSSGDAGVTGTLNVPANNVIWADNMHLTFIHNYLFDAMYSYVNVSEVFFKDRDITYTDQNTKPPPIANLKIWPRAQRLINGEATFWLDASDSYAIADSKTITTYALTCYPMTDTTVTFNTSTGIGRVDITGSTPDYRWLKLTVTDSNSKTQDTWRCIFVHGETPEDTGYPHINFEIGSLSGGWETAGWKLDFNANDNASLADIPDMSFAAVWQERTVDAYPNNTVRVGEYLFVNPRFGYKVEPGSPCTVTVTLHAGVMKNGVPSDGDTISVDFMAGGTGWTNDTGVTSNGEVSIWGTVITGADCSGTLVVRENSTSTTLVSKSYIPGQTVPGSSYYPADFIVFPQELIVGYTRTEKLDFDNDLGSGQDAIKITTVEGLLKNGFMFSVEMDSRPSVTAWHEYENWLTIGRACHHIWRWHSTLIHIANVYGLTDNTDIRSSAIFENGSLYSMPDTMARQHGIRAHVVCNKKGDLWLTQDTQLLLDADRAALDTVAVITPDDRSNDFSLTREPEPDTALVYGSGLKFIGTYTVDSNTESDTYSLLIPDVEAYCATAPGVIPSQRGEAVINIEKQVLTSQDQLNQLVGRVIGQANNIYPDMQATFHGGYLYFIDVHLTEFWEIDIATGDTVRELAIPDLNLIARDIMVKVDTEKGSSSVDVTFEPEAEADIGVYSECPGPPSDLGGAVPIISVGSGSGAIVTASSVDYRPPGTSAWTQRTAEATECLITDPYWRIKAASSESSDAILIRGGVGYIKRSTNAGVSWSTVTPSTDPPNTAVDAIAPTKTGVTYAFIKGSNINQDEFCFVANWQNAGGAWRSWLWFTDDDFVSGSWLYLGGDATDTCTDLANTPEEIDPGISNLNVMPSKRHLCKIDTDKYVISYEENGTEDIYVQVVDVSSGTPVLGAQVLTDLSVSATICKVDTDKFAILDNNYLDPLIHIGTVNTITITLGTSTNWISAREISELVGAENLGTAQSSSAYQPRVCSPSPSVLHISRLGIKVDGSGCTRNINTDGVHVCKGTISGTVFTPDTILCGTSLYPVNDWDSTYPFYQPRQLDHIAMNSNVSLFCESYGTGVESIKMGAYDTTTGMGSIVAIGVAFNYDGFALTRLSDTKAILFWVDTYAPLGNHALNAIIITLSGTTITAGTAEELYASDGHVMGFVQSMEISSTEAAIVSNTGNGCHLLSRIVANTTTNIITSYDTCAYTWEYTIPHDVIGIDSDDFLLLRTADVIGGISYDPSVTIAGYNEYIGNCSDNPLSFRGLGVAIGNYTGTISWITGDNGNTLELLEVTLSTMTVAARTSLGSATHAQVDSRLYYAIPATYWGNEGYVVVGGRFINPTTSNLVQLAFTGDGAATFFDQEASWGSDYCGALLTYPADILFAIRNTGVRSKLYSGAALTTLTLLSTTGLLAGVNPDSIDIGQDYAIVVAADVGGAIMVVASPSPYQVWYDITSDHPTANGVNSLVVL